MNADDPRSAERNAPVRAWLECDLEAEPIEGTLTQPEGQKSRFIGWLGLTAALQRLGTDRLEERGGQ